MFIYVYLYIYVYVCMFKYACIYIYIYIYTHKHICPALRFATGWTVRDRIPLGGGRFFAHPDRPWGLPNLLYNGYRVFSGGKVVGAWR